MTAFGPPSQLATPAVLAVVSVESEPTPSSSVELNPFGATFTTLTWIVLVALNAWCFRKLLKRTPAKT